MTTKNPFTGSERELLSLTKDLDELHNDVGVPAMGAGVERMVEAAHSTTPSVRGTSRRTFLLGAGATTVATAALLGAGVPGVAGALTRGRTGTSGPDGRAFPPAGLSGDLAVAAVAASLENLAIFAYSAGLAAATAGKLGSVPPAVATFATTARAQHTQHAAAWNA
ncbi:MAG TPA: ferritin-like domain-containing protein, partial [Acidimicrobiales bacterium]|nr:ferritin-like domain-containing protein [Acidimicrobiales bacterium]